MAYITTEQAADFVGAQTQWDSASTALIGAFATAAQTAIEQRTRRKWELPTADSTRYYGPNDLRSFRHERVYRLWNFDQTFGYHHGKVLWLADEVYSVTSLTNGDGTLFDPTTYWLLPRNDGPPWRYIALKSTAAWLLELDQEITLVGKFCTTATAPADIVLATQLLTQFYWRNKDNQVMSTIDLPNGGQITVPKGFPATVEDILRKNNRHRVIGAV